MSTWCAADAGNYILKYIYIYENGEAVLSLDRRMPRHPAHLLVSLALLLADRDDITKISAQEHPNAQNATRLVVCGIYNIHGQKSAGG